MAVAIDASLISHKRHLPTVLSTRLPTVSEIATISLELGSNFLKILLRTDLVLESPSIPDSSSVGARQGQTTSPPACLSMLNMAVLGHSSS